MSGLKLLVNDAHGIYIPQIFVQDFEWNGLKPEDISICFSGPDNEYYWEAWNSILTNATFADSEGNIWRLWQDGDVWAYCEDLMTDAEYYDFFGEYRGALDLEDYWPHDNWYDTSAELK
jgi:hypothetical protein